MPAAFTQLPAVQVLDFEIALQPSHRDIGFYGKRDGYAACFDVSKNVKTGVPS